MRRRNAARNLKEKCMLNKAVKFNKRMVGFCLGLALVLGLSCLNQARAQDASLSLEPRSGSFKVKESFEVKLNVDTAGIPINASEATIYFPADKLEVTAISKDDSIFTFWTEEPQFSNSEGKILFSGGLPHPGFNGTGRIFTIKFAAKNTGAVYLSFDDACVLADDGQGTGILKFLREAKYLVIQPGPASSEPRIFSPTHPNVGEWYDNNSPKLEWGLNPDIEGVSFVLSQDADESPDAVSEGRVPFITYEDIPDGIWYFVLKFKYGNRWTETNRYQIQVDTSPPHPFELVIDNGGDATNPQPDVYFESDDDVSGIASYKVRVGEQKFFDLMPAQVGLFSVPLQKPGSYKVVVRAADRAGNNTQAKTFLTIAPLDTPQVNIWPEKYISGEDIFYIEGQTIPGTEVLIILKKDDKEVKEWQALGDSSGGWFFSTRETLKPGTYYLGVRAQDARGAESNASDLHKIEVLFSGISVGPVMITFRSLIYMLVTVLCVGAALALYFIFKISRARKILRKETREAKESLLQNFANLRTEVEKRIELSDAKPGFNEAEKKVYEEIKKALKAAEESINKEIRDIEEEL